MDLETIVNAIVTKYAQVRLDFSTTLYLDDCYKALGDSLGRAFIQSGSSIELEGGLFSIEGTPILLIQVLDLRNASDADDAIALAKYGLILRATEMLFSGSRVFPVLFVIIEGSDIFWDYLRVLQLGYTAEGSCNIYKKGHHSVATTISYISNDACIAIAEEMVEDSLASHVVPEAER